MIAIFGSALLMWATAGATRDVELSELDAFRRLWSDMALGIDAYLDARRPLAPDAAPVYASPNGLDADRVYRRLVVGGVRTQGVRPWQFWRTLPARPFLRERLEPVPKHYDDHGRGRLLGVGFRALGGIAPFLVVWIGALCCVPVLGWASFELVRAGFPRCAATLAALLGLWCFWIESLALTRYAVGFYLVGLLVVVPLSAYAALGPPPSLRGLALRALAGAVCFALAASCRSSVGLLLPGLLLAIGMGVRRLPLSRARRSAAFLCLACLFVLPYPAMRRAQQSDVWQPLWEGLGDFDREKGHAWSDAAAQDAVEAAGGRKLWTPRSEAILRESVLRDIRDDPAWYAGILARRVVAVVLQTKLWPWRPLGGRSMAEGASANEGVSDKYYGYAALADEFGLGGFRVELPIPLLILPLGLLLLRAFGPERWGVGPGRRRARVSLQAVACVAAASFSLPVLITTAGGQETEAFALVYVLSAALLADVLRPTSEDAAG